MSTYPSTNPKKRDAAIKVMLTPAMRAQLDEVAEAMGQTPSTAASFAIGQWVMQQRRAMQATEKALDGMLSGMAPGLVEAITKLSEGKPQ